MSPLGAFLTTWSNARTTFGEGTPQPGAIYDQSTPLDELCADLRRAASRHCWSGAAGAAYATANADHRRVINALSELDRRLARQVDQSAQIVSAGRRDVDSIKDWVVAASNTVPAGEVGELMLLPIVQRGLADLIETVTRANSELGTVSDSIRAVSGDYRALGVGQRFGDAPPESPQDDVDGLGNQPEVTEIPAEEERKGNQAKSFRDIFGRDPASDNDWRTASILDPHSYSPKNKGTPPHIVAARIKPVPGQGVVRTNLFIPSEDVWNPRMDIPPYDNNLGDNRGFSPTAGPEDARVTIYTDFDNGIVVARQNPSVNADTGEVVAGTPSVSAVQQTNGSVMIQYNAADPFSFGGEGLAKGSGISVNGTLAIAPSESGPRVGGDDVTTFPALEIYGDRAGTTTALLQEWPTFFDNAAGPLAGLPFDKDVGDLNIVESFNSVVPQMVTPPEPDSAGAPVAFPITPPVSIVPPGNFTPFGPTTDASAVRIYAPLKGNEFRPGS